MVDYRRDRAWCLVRRVDEGIEIDEYELCGMRRVEIVKEPEVEKPPSLADWEAATLTARAGDDTLMLKLIAGLKKLKK